MNAFLLNIFRNGHHCAVELLLVEAAPPIYVQGIVCSLKESFGFIERADKVNEVCARLSTIFCELNVFCFSETGILGLLHLLRGIFLFSCRYSFTTVSFKVILVIFCLEMTCSLLFMPAMYVDLDNPSQNTPSRVGSNVSRID